ncbi:molybdenum cofactor guanylyltransferase MobA [Oceanisphaera sp. W20_SRM_FM3]|uniref:molybdenum cofactor guanylyltransferase MobA n=1 Tax=Oceanisphaera sp. W20_SRM_FM3 TaxID=3240267 RepID=UPI003F97CF77
MRDIQQVTAVILAGGEGRRMQGADKGLLSLWGRPLVRHLFERLNPQVDQVLINANRNQDRYREYAPVFSDNDSLHSASDFKGPLAGMAAGLQHAAHDWVLFVPCDSPLAPPDLAQRLSTAVSHCGQIAVVDDGERVHPATVLLHKSLLPSLLAYLAAGDRKLQLWYAQHKLIKVDFSDQRTAFTNLNTPEALAELEARARC